MPAEIHENPKPPPSSDEQRSLASRIHGIVVGFIVFIMGLELVFVIFRQQWLNAFLVIAIMLATLSPILLGKRFKVHLPPEFQLMAIAFVFAALFLGEVRHFYLKIWWWDIALHTSSGFLLGVFGFLLVYTLNENAHIELTMRPRFVALFAFLFAVAVGAVWEIFEYRMDSLFGLNMQKPMMSDPSGLTDTMWDLIVDTVGALVVSLTGWWYMRTGKESFIETGIEKFIERNPRFFRSKKTPPDES